MDSGSGSSGRGAALAQEDWTLLQSQRNAVFVLVKKHGLDPATFEWTVTSEGTRNVLRLDHRDSGYYFRFGYPSSTRMSFYSPDEEMRKEVSKTETSWEGQLETVDKWLTLLAREVLVPDLWTTVNETAWMRDGGPADDENIPFSPMQQARIASGLAEIRTFLIQTQALSAAQIEAMDTRLAYLEEASTRLGRKGLDQRGHRRDHELDRGAGTGPRCGARTRPTGRDDLFVGVPQRSAAAVSRKHWESLGQAI